MAARMTYLVCRKAPDRPDGVSYFSGEWMLSRTRTSSVVVAHVRMFRREAWEGDETSARMIANILNELGPNAGVPDAPKWEVLSAAIDLTGGAHAEA